MNASIGVRAASLHVCLQCNWWQPQLWSLTTSWRADRLKKSHLYVPSNFSHQKKEVHLKLFRKNFAMSSRAFGDTEGRSWSSQALPLISSDIHGFESPPTSLNCFAGAEAASAQDKLWSPDLAVGSGKLQREAIVTLCHINLASKSMLLPKVLVKYTLIRQFYKAYKWYGEGGCLFFFLKTCWIITSPNRVVMV